MIVSPKSTSMGLRKYITEFIGTFFLVLTIGMVVISGKGDFAPIAIGSILMTMIFAGAHISGAHYNPAVTMAVLLRGRMKLSEALMYWIVQILGGIVAGVLVSYLLIGTMPEAAVGREDSTRALIVDLIGTLALAYVVLNVATAKGTAGNSFYGIAIGGTVLAMATVIGKFSGGAYNPAVATGLIIQKTFCLSQIWIYLVGAFAGAGLAALVFKMNNPDDK